MIEIQWDDSVPDVIRGHIVKGITWQTYRQGMQTILNMIEQQTNRVDVILTTDAALPTGNPVPHFRYVEQRFSDLPNSGLLISVNDTQFLLMSRLLLTLMQIYLGQPSKKYPVVRTVEEAFRLIEENRPVKVL